MKPNMKDVAALAGVSATTVSRVLNDRGYISEETKNKVFQAMEELHYFPSDVARSLFRKSTKLIGLIFPTTSHPFFGELILNIERFCSLFGYKVLLCNSLNDTDKESKYLEMLQRNQVDGIIVGTHNQGTLDYEKIRFPVVAIDRFLSDNIPVVSSDNYQGGKLATERLLESGCKKIIHICGPLKLKTPANLRTIAYKDMMEKHKIKPIIYELPVNFNHEYTIEMIKNILIEHPDVNGIFTSDDLIAASVLTEAANIGKKVPNDLKVIGYDGTETVQICLPHLTTIKQPIKLIAEKSVSMLIELIEGKQYETNLEEKLPVLLKKGTTA
ncbi:LacI family DNA-binding transcriptional regulator [Bacillota bacterium Lsc_1132]